MPNRLQVWVALCIFSFAGYLSAQVSNGNPVDFSFRALNLFTDQSYSSYNSLQVELRQLLTRGLAFQTSYTLAHALSDLWEEN